MRDYESVSSLDTFLKCPKAYRLSYIENIKPEVPDRVEFGKYFHKQLEIALSGGVADTDVEPFLFEFKQWLESENKKVKEVEKDFEVNIEGLKLKGRIDAILDDGTGIEFKFTQYPDNYSNKIDFQTSLYSYVLGKPVIYVLFEIDKNFNFVNMYVEYVPISEMLLQKRIREIIGIYEMLNLCKQKNCFPPSFNGCKWCFYKKHCDDYLGG